MHLLVLVSHLVPVVLQGLHCSPLLAKSCARIVPAEAAAHMGLPRPRVYPGRVSSAQAAARLTNPAEATQELSFCRSSTTSDCKGDGSKHQHSFRHQRWPQGAGSAASMACGGHQAHSDSQQQPCLQHLHVMLAVRPGPPGAQLSPARVFPVDKLMQAGRMSRQCRLGRHSHLFSWRAHSRRLASRQLADGTLGATPRTARHSNW